jgi:hypothetical protein
MYKVTYHDGSSEEINDEEEELLKSEVDFVSYKRSRTINYESISVEMSSNVGTVGLKKTMAYIRQQTEYECEQAVKKYLRS